MTSSSMAIETGRNYLIAIERNRTVWDELRAEVGTALVVVLFGGLVVGIGVYIAASVLIGIVSLLLESDIGYRWTNSSGPIYASYMAGAAGVVVGIQRQVDRDRPQQIERLQEASAHEVAALYCSKVHPYVDSATWRALDEVLQQR